MQSTLSVSDLLEALAGFATAVWHTANQPDADWTWRPAEGEWSLVEVVCHLRDVEREVHLPRFREILARDMPFLPGVSSNEWAAPRAYQLQDGPQAAADFCAARLETLTLLRGLDDAAWQRQGRHAFFGATSIRELAGLMRKHDEAHGAQIAALRRHGGGGGKGTQRSQR